MRTCYIAEATRSIADLVAPGELTKWWTITRINVPREHRSRGHGTELLQRITSDADAEGVVLALEPYPSGGLDYNLLVLWYERNGFTMTKTGYMVRRPNKED